MTSARSTFDELLAEAEKHVFEGWDFSFMDGRYSVDPAPWDYVARVLELGAGADSMVDLGTGGGEFVASLPRRAQLTVATEGWMPNVAVADRVLRPLGVHVVAYEGAPDNAAQRFTEVDGALPFRDQTFDLVVDRHEAFRASEVARVLRSGGTFLTLQAGSRNEIEINRMLGDVLPSLSPTLEEYVSQLERAGLRVDTALEAFPEQRYFDVGAIVYKLRMIPWQYEGFDVVKHRDGLRRMHEHIERNGSFPARHHRFLLKAVKP